MLPNRVDPTGQIITTSARGAWMGNRGALHNAQQKIIRPFRTQAWLTCRLEFKGRKRTVMAPGKYTELFFLDEATAFSAGHRPCAECRREDYQRFKTLWVFANPAYGFTAAAPIGEIDEVLQHERMTTMGSKKTYTEVAGRIPDGVFVLIDAKPHVVLQGSALLWTPVGYADRRVLLEMQELEVLTPRSIVRTLRAGYLAQIHSSAYAHDPAIHIS